MITVIPSYVIEYQGWITRKHLRNHPDCVYVFGDNALRRGLGGQAKEMRGEPNALGIATKLAPGTNEADYFSDSCGEHMIIMQTDITKVLIHLGHKKVILPAGGLGTGLSKLPEKAPRMYRVLYEVFAAISDCPWPEPKLFKREEK